MNKLIYILILASFFSCAKKSKVNNIAIASVNSEKLYKEDIANLVPPGTSKSDSVIIVKDFIDRWASRKLLFNAAQVNLSAEKLKELNDLVDQYKKDLYTKAYIEELVYKSLDTIVTNEYLTQYYEKSKEQFRTNEPLVKMSFIQINKKNSKLEALSSKFLNGSKESKASLKSNAVEFKSYAFNDSIWIDMNQVYEKLPFINSENSTQYIVPGKTIRYADSLDVYLIKTNNFIAKNQTAPFQYIKPTLEKVIINNRKKELINKYQTEITQDAIKDKKYEIYK